MFCPNCGANVPENSKFCPRCGTKIYRFGGQDQSGTVTAGSPGAGIRKLSGRTIGIIVAAAVVVIAVIIIIIATSGKKSYTVSWYATDGTPGMQISYDGSDTIQSMIIYDSYGDPAYLLELSKDSDKYTQKYTLYDEENYLNNESIYIQYVYENGKPSSSAMYDSDNNVLSYTRYVYDNKGNIQTEYYYDEHETYEGRVENSYDDYGNKIAETYYNSYGSVETRYRMSYIYKNNAGKVQSFTFYIDGEETAYGVYEYN